jgi:hypothetical protein
MRVPGGVVFQDEGLSENELGSLFSHLVHCSSDVVDGEGNRKEALATPLEEALDSAPWLGALHKGNRYRTPVSRLTKRASTGGVLTSTTSDGRAPSKALKRSAAAERFVTARLISRELHRATGCRIRLSNPALITCQKISPIWRAVRRPSGLIQRYVQPFIPK